MNHMSKLRYIREGKENIRTIKKPLAKPLPTEDRLRIFANLVIDRILEEQTKGNLNIFEKQKES